MELQDLVHHLTEFTWTAEQQTREPVDGRVLSYVRDAVTAEIECRRRKSGLASRLVEFEVGGGRAARPEPSEATSPVLPSDAGRSPISTGEGRDPELAEIDRRLGALEREMAKITDHLPRAVQGIGIVRYNAFPGMGGNISFSLALLDGRENGVVVSVLNGRETARVSRKGDRGRPAQPRAFRRGAPGVGDGARRAAIETAGGLPDQPLTAG